MSVAHPKGTCHSVVAYCLHVFSMFSAKKILVIAIVVLLLIGIPVTIYLLQQQQEVRSRAQAATTLGFTPTSTASVPIQAKVNDVVDLKLSINPSSNLVSFVRLEIQYDSTKLATASGTGGTDAFEPNKVAFPTVNEGPVYQDGKILVTLSVGSDPTKAIQTVTDIGTIHFRALAGTDTPTQVIYGTQSQVLSIGSTDQASENVLSSSTPAVIAIVTPTTVETPTPEITETPTDTPTPTTAANQSPVCTSLTADVTSGAAPLAVNFTAIGNDSDGTINKIDLDFGDGTTSTVTDSLGTASVSASTAHSYNAGGTFKATATMTDDGGASNTSAACLQTISVAGPTATPTATLSDTPTPTLAGADTPTPTIASPGPGATIIGLGAFFSVLSLIGAVLFFAL